MRSSAASAADWARAVPNGSSTSNNVAMARREERRTVTSASEPGSSASMAESRSPGGSTGLCRGKAVAGTDGVGDETPMIALTREASPAIERCELTHLSRVPIDLDRARAQHAAFERALAGL